MSDRTRTFAARGDLAHLAPFLTVNEKRAAVGYAPVESGDVFT